MTKDESIELEKLTYLFFLRQMESIALEQKDLLDGGLIRASKELTPAWKVAYNRTLISEKRLLEMRG